jgi:hypothetical protein
MAQKRKSTTKGHDYTGYKKPVKSEKYTRLKGRLTKYADKYGLKDTARSRYIYGGIKHIYERNNTAKGRARSSNRKNK